MDITVSNAEDTQTNVEDAPQEPIVQEQATGQPQPELSVRQLAMQRLARESAAEEEQAPALELDPKSVRAEAMARVAEEDKQMQLRSAEYFLRQAAKLSPEQNASINNLAKRYGISPELAKENHEALKQKADIEDLLSAMEQSPVLREQLTNPRFASLATEDARQLILLERFARSFASGLVKGVGLLGDGAGALAQSSQVYVTEAIARRLLPTPQSGNKLEYDLLHGQQSDIGDMWRRAGSDLFSFAETYMSVPESQRGMFDDFGEGLGQFIPLIMTGMLTGGAAAPIIASGVIGAGAQSRQVKDDEARHIDRAHAITSAGAVSAATAALPLHIAVNSLSAPIKNEVAKYIATIAGVGTVGFLSEAAESAAHDALQKTFTNPDVEVDWGGAAYEGIIGAEVDVAARIILDVFAHSIGKGARKQRAAEKAIEDFDLLLGATEAASKVGMAEHSLDEYTEYLNKVSEDTSVENIYIAADALYQSGHIDQLKEVLPELADQIERAASSGADVAIPFADYMAKVARTDFVNDLVPHFKLDPAGMSRIEAEQYILEKRDEALEEEFAEVVEFAKQNEEFTTSLAKVQDEIYQQAKIAGRYDDKHNALFSSLAAHHIGQRARQAGVTPEQLFAESKRLQIARGFASQAETYAQQVTQQAEQIRQQFAGTEQYMKAPNGEQSMLNEIQWAQVRTPAFKEWFGDWENDPASASKILDENGEPMVVYRGLTQPYSVDADAPLYTWTTPNQALASEYADGAEPLSLYGVIRNPLDLGYRVIDADARKSEVYERLQDAVLQQFESGAIDGVLTDSLIERVQRQMEVSDAEVKPVWQWLSEDLEFKKIAQDAGFDAMLAREGVDSAVDTIGLFEPTQIKSATENIGAFDAADPNIYHQFAGESALTANLEALSFAKDRIARGDDAEQVRKDTGWHQGAEGRWRFEIDDSEAFIKKPYPTKGQLWGDVAREFIKRGEFSALGNMVNHPKLFAAYPQLADVGISTKEGLGASFDYEGGYPVIRIGESETMSDILSIVLHEVQHSIQHIEGFATGASEKAMFLNYDDIPHEQKTTLALQYIQDVSERAERELAPEIEQQLAEQIALWEDADPALVEAIREEAGLTDEELADYFNRDAFQAYRHAAGEIEARNTQARQGLTAIERQELSPEDTADIPKGDAIIVMNGQIVDLIPEQTQDAYYQSAEQNLFVGHNLSAENILAAHELGGLAAPSLAIGRADIGFDNFGEITLLAEPSLLDDKKIRTFDADIYSPRQPRSVLNINAEKFFKFTNDLAPRELHLNEPYIETVATDGVRELMRSSAVRYAYLKEVGKLPTVKNIKADAEVKKAAKVDVSKTGIHDSEKIIELAKQRYLKRIEEKLASGKDDALVDYYFNEDGSLARQFLDEFARDVSEYKRSGGKDFARFIRDMDTKLEGKKASKDFEAWANKKLDAVVEGKRLFKGYTASGSKRYVDYSLDNVVKEMTSKLKAGENFFYGTGSVRAQYANEMRTLDQIKARREQIITQEEMEVIQEQSSQVMDDAIEKLTPFYKYDANSYSARSDMMQSLAAGKKGISEAFDVTPQSKEIIDNLVGYLSNLPTAYFEAKAQRAVDFGEFKIALAPKGANKEAVKILKDAGVKIKYYDPKQEGARQQLLAEQQDLLFQKSDLSKARGAYSPSLDTIALFENANLSTFLHELGHYFLETDVRLAGELIQKANQQGYEALTSGEREILASVKTTMDWFGISGAGLDMQLTNWEILTPEERREYHEQFAESFERYLFEGKAPSIEMQTLFNRFRNFLTSVYKTMKNFLAQNPRAGKLSDEVREVFDRMLASEEEIRLAQQGRSMMPLFKNATDAEAVGMTREEFAEYQKTNIDATDDAVADYEAKVLRDARWATNLKNKEMKRLNAEAADLRAGLEMEVRKEVMQLPVFQAWRFLTGTLQESDKIKTSIDKKYKGLYDTDTDTIQKAIAKAGGINKQELIDDGFDRADKLESGIVGKPTFRAGGKGLSMDAMAELLAELGYVKTDEHGKAEVDDLRDKIERAVFGEAIYSQYADFELIFEGRKAGTSFDLEQLSAQRLDLHELQGMEDVTVAQIDGLKKLKMTSSEGLHPDLVAQLFGYRDGAQLVEDLLRFEHPEKAVTQLANLRMLDEHGEVATPHAREVAAMAAINNELKAKAIATEANVLARATGQQKVMREAAKQFAYETIARAKVKEIKPHTFEAAAAKAGEAAKKSMTVGKVEQAAAEKRNQLINTYTSKEARSALEEVDAGVRAMKKAADNKNIDADYRDQIHKLLERMDLRKSVSGRRLDKREDLRDWIERQQEDGIEPDLPPALLDEANRTHYKEMTMDGFRELVLTIKQIERIGRNKKKLLTAKDKRELASVVEEIASVMNESVGHKKVNNEVRNYLASKTMAQLKSFTHWHRKAANISWQIDGWQEGGAMWDYFVRPMNEAASKELKMKAEATQELSKITTPILKQGKLNKEDIFYPELGRSLNKGERLAILLNWGNEGNRQRLLSGYGWSAEQLASVFQSYTKQELEFAQKVWDYFETYRPEIARIEKLMNGKEPDWVEPAQFTVLAKDGEQVTMRGGYYPIKYDPRQSERAESYEEALEADKMRKAAFTASTTRHSFTKARASEVHDRPILLSMDGIWRGFDEVIHDISWREWSFDANRLLRKLDQPVRDALGVDAIRQLKNQVRDMAAGAIPPANAIEGFLSRIRNGSTIVSLGWSFTTAMMQLPGITQSIVRVGGKDMMAGLNEFYGSPLQMKAKMQEVQEKSLFMKDRATTLTRDISEIRNRMEAGRSDLRVKMEASYFVLIVKTQAMIDYPTWLGAYNKASKDPKNINKDGTLNEERMIALADQAVRDSQGSGLMSDLSGVERGGPLQKLFTNFYNYFNTMFNLSYMVAKRTNWTDPKDVLAAMADYTLLMVIPALFTAIAKNLVVGEDDPDKYLKSMAAEMVGYPLAATVITRDMAGAAQTILGVGTPFDYSGPASLRFYSALEKLANSLTAKEIDELRVAKNLNTVTGLLFNYPAGAINKMATGIDALVEGKTQNPVAPLFGVAHK